MDPGLNKLLKWGVENSSTSQSDSNASPQTTQGLNPDTIAALFGGPSDADLMKESMAMILSTDPKVTLEDKLTAFDNFEQLVEQVDNANNLGPLALWSPLLSCLAHEKHEIRMMAAWCVGTAVQNNQKSQERLLAQGAIPRLVELATSQTEDKKVRRKALYALSSECRNYQPAMDAFTEEMNKIGRKQGRVDATAMEAADAIFTRLRHEVSMAP